MRPLGFKRHLRPAFEDSSTNVIHLRLGKWKLREIEKTSRQLLGVNNIYRSLTRPVHFLMCPEFCEHGILVISFMGLVV
jgi:hypothetical protein